MPFRNIARLATGDFLAKTLTFLAFIYVARVLGVELFGVVEFAGSLLTWFLLAGDAGLEMWATREAARSNDLRALIGRVVPLRLILATLSFAVLLGILPLLKVEPEAMRPLLQIVLLFFGLSVFLQAVTLKWVFLGQEKMTRVGFGLVAGQIVFAVGVFALVRTQQDALWVPILRLASDAATAAYFAASFAREHGGLRPLFTLRGSGAILRPALTLGASQALALLNYNFDAVLLGFLRGVRDVGFYNAAYRPVTVALAVPLTYFQGLFPALARTWGEGPQALRALAERSLRLCAMVAVPLGVGGTMLAEPVIALLFGPQYAESAMPLKLLIWSAALVILRGSYRHSLNAAGLQNLDLRCALVSCGLNVALNIALIPRYGMVGAAGATVFADLVWFALAAAYFNRGIAALSPLAPLARPALAGVAMAAVLWLGEPLQWMLRGGAAVAVYFIALLALGEPEIRRALASRHDSAAPK
jgi:O-antigen/teichoic acid export membrane protein